MKIFWTRFCVRIQQRWVFAVMGFFGVINTFTMRICLSMAITKMVKPMEVSPLQSSDDACPASSSFSTFLNSSADHDGGIYEWDEYTQGMILSSFYWGYVLTAIPGGLLSERFGGKYLLGLGILSSGILTLLTPSVVRSYDSTGLMILRLLMGIVEGVAPPAVGHLIAQWAPPNERTTISTIVISGMPIGTVLGNALSGILIRHSSIGWPVVFYFFGSCAILWFFAWVLLCYSHPDVHPFITDEEKRRLSEAMKQHNQRERQPTPWLRMVASLPLWSMLIGNIGFSWGFLTMVSDLPKYMSSVLKLSIEANGLLSAVPHLLTWVVGNASSWISDWLIKTEKVSRTTVRKVLFTVSSVFSAIFLIAASYAECDRILVVTFFTLGVGMMGFSYPSVMVNSNDLSPNYSGTLAGLVNLVASLTGIVVPYVVGVLTPNQTLSEWRIVFWITVIISVGSNLVYAVWGDGDVQQWNNPEPRCDKKENRVRRHKNSLMDCIVSRVIPSQAENKCAEKKVSRI